MFVCFNSQQFGLELRRIRLDLGYTQSMITELTGINMDTLRKIEKGEVIPKFETLEILSDLFKVNFLQILDGSKSHNLLQTLYDEIDYIITNRDIIALQRISIIFDNLDEKSENLINKIEYEQFRLFLQAIQLTFIDSQNELNQALSLLISSLRKTHKSYSILNTLKFRFSFFELRMVYLVASILRDLDRTKESNLISLFILERFVPSKYSNKYLKHIFIKNICNISYNYHLENNIVESIRYAEMGINYCVENDILYWLHFLYYRKAVAMFMLKEPNFLEFFSKSIVLLQIQKLTTLENIYRKSAKELYNVEI